MARARAREAVAGEGWSCHRLGFPAPGRAACLAPGLRGENRPWLIQRPPGFEQVGERTLLQPLMPNHQHVCMRAGVDRST